MTMSIGSPSVAARNQCRFDPLISVQDLQLLCQSAIEPPVLIGVLPAWRFAIHHLPNSFQVWRPQITSSDGARLIDAVGFQLWARRLGIHPRSRVVLWDEIYDAPRLWWAFHHFGKFDVQVLDGGLRAWSAAGLPLKRGRPRRHPLTGSFISNVGSGFPIAERHMVEDSRANPRFQLWDTRDLAEWDGLRRLKGARCAGRIDWAQHLDWRVFRRGAPFDNRFKTHEQLAATLDSFDLDHNKEHIFYCQSGVRTTTAILALYRLGWDPAQLLNYDGSWREWSQTQVAP